MVMIHLRPRLINTGERWYYFRPMSDRGWKITWKSCPKILSKSPLSLWVETEKFPPRFRCCTACIKYYLFLMLRDFVPSRFFLPNSDRFWYIRGILSCGRLCTHTRGMWAATWGWWFIVLPHWVFSSYCSTSTFSPIPWRVDGSLSPCGKN